MASSGPLREIHLQTHDTRLLLPSLACGIQNILLEKKEKENDEGLFIVRGKNNNMHQI